MRSNCDFIRRDLSSVASREFCHSVAGRCLGVSVLSKKSKQIEAQQRNEEREGGGGEAEGKRIQADPSARNKRAFKNWFLVDTRCPVARVPNSN